MRAAIERSEQLNLYVAGSQRATLVATRRMLRQLARRYLASQGLRQVA
jgi:formate dehydrogenase assembly factor FdhD